jgi:hypothetical protein
MWPCVDRSGFVDKNPPASFCKLDFRAHDDAVVLTLTIYFGDFDHSDIPATLRGVPHQELGPWTARPGQVVELRQMTKFGLEALEVKVIPLDAAKLVTPETLSDVPSATLEFVKADRARWYVTLRNRSSKGMTSYFATQQYDLGRDPQDGGIWQGLSGVPIVGPSTDKLLTFGGPIDAKTPPKIVLRAAHFDDDTYEGDSDYFPVLMAAALEFKYQNVRILDVIGGIVADPTLDDKSKLARIRSDVSHISDIPDPELMAELRSRFPKMSGKAKWLVERRVEHTMNAQKSFALISLGRFERNEPLFESGGRAKVATLAEWFQLWRSKNVGLPEPAQ